MKTTHTNLQNLQIFYFLKKTLHLSYNRIPVVLVLLTITVIMISGRTAHAQTAGGECEGRTLEPQNKTKY